MFSKKISLVIFLCLGCVLLCSAQRSHNKKIEKRFSAGIIGGLTLSQLDGDNYTGYDYTSLFGGLKVSAYLHRKLSFDVNILFVQKGASIENEEIEFRVNYQKNRLIHLQYAEVPFLLTLKPHGYESKLFFEGGLAFSKLLNIKVEENVRDFTDVSFEAISSEFNTTDISAIVGIGSYFTKNLSLGIRFSYGLNKIYVNENPIYRMTLYEVVPQQVLFLRNYYLSANLSFTIF